MQASLVGQELVGFRLTSVLGEGATAIVFRGENTFDSTIMRALKVVRPELAGNEEFVRRFTAEARILEKLEHPNIVRFFGVRRARGYLVMELELLDGSPISSYSADHEPSMRDLARWILQASEGVAAAHAMGVVHRDLKPENVFITRDGEVKVLDFGISRVRDDVDRGNRYTVAGAIPGTPQYMAPEVCSGAVPDASADVYALALMHYELIVGHHPLAAPGSSPKTAAQWMFAQVHEAIPSLRSLRPDVPAGLDRVLTRGLAKDPARRYRSAQELAEALREIIDELPATTAPRDGGIGTRFTLPKLSVQQQQQPSPPPVVARSTPVKLRGRRNLWLAAAGLVTTALVVSGVWWFSHRGHAAAKETHELAGQALLDGLVAYRERVAPLIEQHKCEEVDAIIREATAKSSLIARELQHLNCQDPTDNGHGFNHHDVYAVPIANDPAEGPADAPVTLVIACDYGIGYCARLATKVAELRRSYGSHLRIVHKTSLYSPRAKASALAACAAAKQGQFEALERVLWTEGYGKKQFDTGDSCWEDDEGCPVVTGFARDSGLDVPRFQADMRTCDEVVTQDKADFEALGLQAVPEMFVNGRYIANREVDGLVSLIDEQMKVAQERIRAGTPAAEYYQRWVLDKGIKRRDPESPKIAIDTPDARESKDILAREPEDTQKVYIREILIGWQGSSRETIARQRSKADADTLVDALVSLGRTHDLRPYEKVLSENAAARARSEVVNSVMICEQCAHLAFRLHVGEVGAVRSEEGWHVIQRIATLPAPPDVAKPPAVARRTEDGVFFKILAPGTGYKHPDPHSRVRVHVTMWSPDGEMHSSSQLSGDPLEVPMDQVGWLSPVFDELFAGGRARVWVHVGATEDAGDKPGDFVADVELLEILSGR